MLYRNIEQYKYQLAGDEVFETGIKGYSFDLRFIQMERTGRMTIREGYFWNGASGPTFDTESAMSGSLIHDALYECMRREVLPLTIKDHADRILHDVCTENGMIPIRADAWYDMVRAFAWNSCKPGTETKDQILEV